MQTILIVVGNKNDLSEITFIPYTHDQRYRAPQDLNTVLNIFILERLIKDFQKVKLDKKKCKSSLDTSEELSHDN